MADLTYKYDPERWLESLLRALKNYTEVHLDESVLDDVGDPVGLSVYEVHMEFPGSDVDAGLVPLTRTLIHFAVDDIAEKNVGFGDNVFNYNYDEVTQDTYPQEAAEHRINFDVGIWSSDRSGGTTARARARQVLRILFTGPMAAERLRSETDDGDGGLQILTFGGGRFVTERVNDIDVYRMVDAQLEIRVYSRTPLPAPSPAIEEIGQQPGLTIL